MILPRRWCALFLPPMKDDRDLQFLDSRTPINRADRMGITDRPLMLVKAFKDGPSAAYWVTDRCSAYGVRVAGT